MPTSSRCNTRASIRMQTLKQSKFFLVHGTFAPGSKWTQPVSKLRTTILKDFNGETTFTNFVWNGENAHTDRSASADALREKVRESLEDAPDTDHWIIAHSHGGTIASMAVGDQSFPENFRGLICLATPFFVATPRVLLFPLQFAVRVVSVFFLLTFAVYFFLWAADSDVVNTWAGRALENPADAWPMTIGAVLSLAYIVFDLLLLRQVRRLVRVSSRDFAQEVNRSNLIEDRTFCITSRQDEVIIAFRLAYLLTGASKFILGWKAFAFFFVAQLAYLIPKGNGAIFAIGDLWGETVFAATIVLILPLAVFSDTLVSSEWVSVFMVPVAAVMSAFVVLVLSLAGLALAVALQYLATVFQVGWRMRWNLQNTLFSDTNVRTRPTCLAEHCQTILSVRRCPLAHSAITSSDSAIDEVIRILSQTARG